ncbi:hypothetical protein ACTZWT_23205 [Rhodopseudomonas sp. NSM]|uniref:hypothetical protein n=1 Tax=Rhodopseudomonas sp. NSM TaxID=3457630 RepID=UPI00403753C0
MTLDDLFEDFRFRQADLLQLVPGLNQGMLQAWKARGYYDVDRDESDGAPPLADRRRKHAKALWTGSGVIATRFVVETANLGIKPSEAFGLADRFVADVEDFMGRFKPSLNEATGLEEYTFEAARAEDYRRVEIVRRSSGKLSIVPAEMVSDAGKRVLMNAMLYGQLASVAVESDLIFMVTLNGIIRHTAGRDRQTGTIVRQNEE